MLEKLFQTVSLSTYSKKKKRKYELFYATYFEQTIQS
jgi:hypothetical protein